MLFRGFVHILIVWLAHRLIGKIKDGWQSGRKVVTHDSKRVLPLVFLFTYLIIGDKRIFTKNLVRVSSYY